MYSYDPNESEYNVYTVLAFLKPFLPKPLPLYRRLQFEHFSPVSRVITSVDIENIRKAVWNPQDITIREPWLIAYSDPDQAPATQVHIYGSWEHNPPPGRAEDDSQIRVLIRSFISNLHSSKVYDPSTFTPQQRTRILTTINPNPSIPRQTTLHHTVLLGSVHTSTAHILHSMNLLDPTFEHSTNMPGAHNKWIFDLRPPSTSTAFQQSGDGRLNAMRDAERALEMALEPHLRWGTVREEDYPLVQSRTGIRRPERVLRMLPSVAIFPEEEGSAPIAWTFLGVDASLTSLHVEPAFRRQGLAKKLARRAWEKHLDVYAARWSNSEEAKGEKWGHADVAVANEASNGLCKSLGGRNEWVDYWFRADLDRFEEAEGDDRGVAKGQEVDMPIREKQNGS